MSAHIPNRADLQGAEDGVGGPTSNIAALGWPRHHQVPGGRVAGEIAAHPV